jgi:hypothetical protein
MISIVVCYNNEQALGRILLPSLKNQTALFELIKLDNTGGRFNSAAEALNYGAKQANGKYIMFVHQDVDLCSVSWVEDAEKMLDSISDLGIAGVAGMCEIGRSNKERGRNIIKHGENHRQWEWSNPICEPERVQTLDECLVIIPKSVLDCLKFDEKTCDGWHLYAVDYCLSCKRLGLDAFALPMFIYHRGNDPSTRTRQILLRLGMLPGYFPILRKVLQKHRNHYGRIYTSCGDWHTAYPVLLQRTYNVAIGGIKFIMRKLRWRSAR